MPRIKIQSLKYWSNGIRDLFVLWCLQFSISSISSLGCHTPYAMPCRGAMSRHYPKSWAQIHPPLFEFCFLKTNNVIIQLSGSRVQGEEMRIKFLSGIMKKASFSDLWSFLLLSKCLSLGPLTPWNLESFAMTILLWSGFPRWIWIPKVVL